MTPIVLILIGIFLLIFLIVLDFKTGRRNHRQHQPLHILYPKRTGDYRFYKTGPAFFDDLFQDIRDAKQQIDVQFFIVKQDELSQEFLRLLKQKANEGLTVRLLLDRLGSSGFTTGIIHHLEQSGIQFHFMQKPSFPYFFYKLNQRNHRKITVIDERITYTGGFNIGKEYVGKDAIMGNWRDYHIRLVGTVVTDLHQIFFHDWQLTTGEEHQPKSDQPSGQHDFQVLATDGEGLASYLLEEIQQAEREILISSPYFIPSQALMDAIKQACQRGVEVTVLAPLKSDHPLVKEGGIPFMKKLVQAGGNLYLFDNGFYHAKMVMIDQKSCTIGTANFDQRSFFLNKEVSLMTGDETLIEDLRNRFFLDAIDAIVVDNHWFKQRSLGTRINVVIARLLRPLL
ncbi:cardiolipin synthase [Thalassobacillus sp. CUG 92003]|uniref:cardiolipin synthase n=1 Tax=Thalassobacillus sp. CUG 92003 TaxID=2736641 RepID=UPI0015E6E8AA|nr:cardiolipin synthase [Thalassobacillus sp. CUG 92003]